MSSAVSVEKLGKSYRLGVTHAGSLRELVNRATSKVLRRSAPPPLSSPLHEHVERIDANGMFWALHDVSFEIEPGEVVGIIGRNGGGKSTLLKVLSRITVPSTGRVQLTGRVASLLEVGTGFHPELTGRENVFLNGTILGMTRRQVSQKFDEIVDFSGIERFIDTPVKRYSSGMMVRLAFAVAAHLVTEILMVDEILAVGDATFQARCLKKMNAAATDGRTVLFVSHHMQAVANLCDTAIQLRDGQIVDRGNARDVINRYLKATTSNTPDKAWDLNKAPGDDIVRLIRVRVENRSRNVRATFGSAEPIYVVLDVHCRAVPSSLCIGFDLLTSEGTQVFRSYHTDLAEAAPVLVHGLNSLRCEIPAGLLNEDTYHLAARIGLHNVKWCVKEDSVAQFHVSLTHGTSSFWNSLTGPSRGGVVAPVLDWQAL